MNYSKRSWRSSLVRMGKGLLAATLVVGSLLFPIGNSYAESNSLIRVALFADIGSKYKSTVPVISLQSNQEWSVLSKDTPTFNLISVPAKTVVRFSLDSYRVKVLETTLWKEAADAAKKLQTTSDKPILFVTSKNGGNLYQLYTGMYASETAAKDAAVRVGKSGVIIPTGQTTSVKGSKHLTAGVFATQLEADSVVSNVLAAGFDAWTVILPSGDSIRYEVWIGEAANDIDLSGLQTLVSQSLPQLSLSAVAASSGGLILRTDAGQDWSTEGRAPHYMISGNGAKFIAAGNETGIQLTERSKRTYRGDFELSGLNGSLAVINVVPLEKYLYAVVGGEVSSGWAVEALKAQAVAARSYARSQGNRFDVANVVDTTLSQVYNGIGAEAPVITKAVDATAGEVLMSEGKIVEAVFSSNSGGFTADPSEVWGNGGNMFGSVASPTDISAAATSKNWYNVMLSDGTVGYVREDNVKLTGAKTSAGLEILTASTQGVNIRPLPIIQSDVNPVGKLNPGDNAVVLNKVIESGSYSWIRGPYTSAELLKSLQGITGSTLPTSIISLEVTQRGPSGRAVQVKANGEILKMKYPDLFRSGLNGLPSTLFDIVPSASYTVLGADGVAGTVSNSQNANVLSASGTVSVSGSGTLIMGGDSTARVISSKPGFLFIGRGNGHGLGMSQWGVKGMADNGYDYKQILQHYYRNVTIVKE